ncbi:diguanylate cyclase [Microcoleus sp. bin38.metabat.b11b12b14.051]|uniref:GGDEF domain-containing protein n=1 Tax=Microcoleus sp. bin38.metabat.b11b12b14.051 TaxID=2742709 RepID=UPI0025E8B821|nr:diguanylate cyclase [Microcoleus sp. bin38.metabat.b11b12b14.051]
MLISNLIADTSFVFALLFIRACAVSVEFIAPSNSPNQPPENLSLESTLKDLAVFNFQLEGSSPAKEVAKIFQAHPLLPGVILTLNGEYFGMISRRRFMEHMSRPYGVDIFACRPIAALYQMAKTEILILPGVALIVMAAQRAVQRPPEQLYEPILVQLEPQVYRLLDVHQVLLALSQIHQQATWYISELYYNLSVTKSDLEAANHQLQSANSELYRLANSDGLTQVANRRCFNEYLEKLWQKLGEEVAEISLILCDIDFFKKYNDTYGHQAGDACLQQVAQTIVEAVNYSAGEVSQETLVARYGGEEFAVILPRTSPEIAVSIAEQIRVWVKKQEIENIKSPVSGCVTLSLGVASTVPGLEISKKDLIAAADRSLYQAKDAGRDRVILDVIKLDG